MKCPALIVIAFVVALGASCAPPPCTPGEDGCPTDAGELVDAGPDADAGFATECDVNRPCGDGSACNAQGACEPACPAGTLSCPCAAGDTCNGPDVVCADDGTCQQIACEAGTIGCGCLPDLSCQPDDDGRPVRCDPDFRVCRAVVDDSDVPGSPSTACFTPCRESVVLSTGIRTCRADGLMEGCIGDLVCVQGSCVLTGENPPACTRPTDCPGFQVCIDGGCYSNCNTEADCAPGSVCDLHVCREPCTATRNSCAQGFACDLIDGETGTCKPLSPPDPVASVPVQPALIVSVDDDRGQAQPPSPSGHESMQFSPTFTTRTFRVTNAAAVPLPVTIRKTSETRLTDSGRVTVNSIEPGPGVTPTNPLFWLHIGSVRADGSFDLAQQQEFTQTIPAGQTRVFVVGEPVNPDLAYWEGQLTVEAPQLGKRPLWLEYASDPSGQWSGNVHYFTNFDDEQLAVWQGNKTVSNARLTKNALLVQWTNFRNNPLFSLQQFRTLLKATRLGSWSDPQTQQACDDTFPNVVTEQRCYLYADGTPGETGLAVYTGDAAEQRIPTGNLEMPFVMNLKRDATDPATLTGRIESTRALQFPGNPAVTLHFGGPADDCEDPTAAACIVPIDGFSSTVVLGGRHLLEPGEGCAAASLTKARTPWLVPEFLQDTVVDPDDGRVYREECKESTFPFASSSGPFAAALNQSFTDSNPIPDGRVRRRELTLLDGIMINQDTMILLVQERFDANLGSGASAASFSAYGVIELHKNDVEPTAGQFVAGTQPTTPTAPAADLLQTTCSADVLEPILGVGVTVDATNAGTVARTLISGVDSTAAALTPLSPTVVANTIHWLCHSTGRFDGGPDSFAGPEPCPNDSLVTYFSLPQTASVKNAACQGAADDRCRDGDCSLGGRPGTCAEQLQALSAATQPLASRATLNPASVCEKTGAPGVPDFDTVACANDRTDLRRGRLFFAAGTGPKFPTLRSAVDDAFRFKSRFRARSGKGIGFVPEVCALDSDVVPYCYDPSAIEALRARVDCLLSLFQGFPAQQSPPAGGMSTTTRSLVKGTLGEVFSFYGETPAGVPLPVGTPPYDGFERLYSELLIMKGDDALTSAASSRFDLAGANNALFEGELLEPDGIQIAGGAGFEMNLLYQAGQYYQLVLDRFARVSPALWKGLDNPNNNFVTLDTISTYFSRVIQASTKKARIASEVATRYRAFNRPDLARRVIERAYAQASLESTAIGQFMRRSVAVLDANQIDALQFELQRATRQTSIALDQMLEDYREITDELSFFGDPPDFISFPQAGNFDTSAVQTMIDRAKDTIQLAKEREERALAVSRTFDTDAAQFQSELSRVANGFENELGDLCGLFEGNDGNVYPAIPKYASESPQTAIFGNPCGLVGNGAIYDAVGDLDQAATDLRIAVQAVKDTQTEANIEVQRARDECGANFAMAQMRFVQAGRVTTIQSTIADQNQKIAAWERELGVLDRQSKLAGSVAAVAQNAAGAASCGDQLFSIAGCIVGNLAAAAASTAVVVLDAIALDQQNAVNSASATTQDQIQANEKAISEIQAAAEFAQQAAQCCLQPVPNPASPLPVDGCVRPGPLMINSQARVQTILIGMKRAELGADRAALEVQLVRGRLAQLQAKANRLVAQQADSEQLLINVQAASNDPNVRILKNADVLDADKSFKNALVDAYRATRVFEYYTGQTYARQSVLFEARLVGRGENSIENYVNDLQRDLRAFEESFGRPSPRLMIVSVKNDVFRVPKVGADGTALSGEARDAEFRRRLQDVSLLDARGYISVPFATELARTSPLTAIHKITGVEVDLAGTGLGDNVARMYLSARGTGTIRNLERDLVFHRFPAITAVVNPTFGTTNRPNDPSLYRNTRLQDRPLINTNWELGLNQRDEFENQDLNLGGLQDIKIYFYYEDFTFVD